MKDLECAIQEFVLYAIDDRVLEGFMRCVQDISRTVFLKIMLTHCGVD